ncbi:MAG: hypothetical protein QM654_16095 [Dysgonamonadaceae bacterium]
MIGDVIVLKERHIETGKNVYEMLTEHFDISGKFTVGIGGESGSGKSVTAFALQKILSEHGISSVVLQMDDYFNLPPRSNHENRLLSFDNVGTHEVNLALLSDNVYNFKAGVDSFVKPLVNYQANLISSEVVPVKDIRVLIVEGTYILENEKDFDFKIFIDRNYKETYMNRMERNRDENSGFIELVLDIEHKIIKQYKCKADLILGKNYQLIIP